MKRIVLSILLWLVCTTSYSQIEIPKEIPLGDPIIATVKTTIPEGAIVEGGWLLSSGLKSVEVDPKTIHLWVKAVGTYKLTYDAFWLNLKDVVIKDAEGKDVQAKLYLGHGKVHEEASFDVTGGINPPPPPPGGPWQIMMFYDADQLDNYPASQRALLISLKYRTQLEAAGHVVLEVLESATINDGVPAKYEAFINSVKGDPLPRIALAPKKGGKVLDYPLPQTWEELEQLLSKPQVEVQ